MRTVHVRIEGRVQGVGYRAWVADSAEAMGLVGWVRNRRDGSVEAVFEGAATDVARMLRACEQGPPGARVERVEARELDEESALGGFEVRATV
jgi:acylphosphatase